MLNRITRYWCNSPQIPPHSLFIRYSLEKVIVLSRMSGSRTSSTLFIHPGRNHASKSTSQNEALQCFSMIPHAFLYVLG